jgi:hypothetical protein
MKLATLLAFVGTLPFAAKSGHLPDWPKPLTALLLALQESRRREAERHIRRYQYLLDRCANPRAQGQSATEAGDTASHEDGSSRGDAQLRSVFLP